MYKNVCLETNRIKKAPKPTLKEEEEKLFPFAT
jgi:hypothetical protein